MTHRGVIALVLLVACAHRQRTFATPADELVYAEARFEQAEYRRAAAAFDHVFATSGFGTPEHAAHRVAIHLVLHELDACVALADRALEAFPGSARVLETRAVCHWERNEKPEAHADAEAALAADPSSYVAAMVVASAIEWAEPARAAEMFRLYLAHRPDDLAPQDARTHLRRAYALLNAGVPDDAVVELQTRFHDRQLRANARRGMCFAYALLDEPDAGVPTCKEVAEPGDDAVKWALARLRGETVGATPLFQPRYRSDEAAE